MRTPSVLQKPIPILLTGLLLLSLSTIGFFLLPEGAWWGLASGFGFGAGLSLVFMDRGTYQSRKRRVIVLLEKIGARKTPH